MDEPGVVPEEPEMLQLANGDIVESAPPIWGIDIKVWMPECLLEIRNLILNQIIRCFSVAKVQILVTVHGQIGNANICLNFSSLKIIKIWK